MIYKHALEYIHFIHTQHWVNIFHVFNIKFIAIIFNENDFYVHNDYSRTHDNCVVSHILIVRLMK